MVAVPAQSPKITVEFVDNLGRQVKWVANGESVTIDEVDSYEYVDPYYDKGLTAQRYDPKIVMRAEIKDYTVEIVEEEVRGEAEQLLPILITHEVRVVAEDNTLPALRAAQKRAGVPKDAQINFDWARGQAQLNERQINVVFSWDEEV